MSAGLRARRGGAIFGADMTPLHRRALLRLLAVVPMAATSLVVLAACGRKADPRPPADADPYAPRAYPVDRSRRPDERLRQDEPSPVPEPPPPPPTPLNPPPYTR